MKISPHHIRLATELGNLTTTQFLCEKFKITNNLTELPEKQLHTFMKVAAQVENLELLTFFEKQLPTSFSINTNGYPKIYEECLKVAVTHNKDLELIKHCVSKVDILGIVIPECVRLACENGKFETIVYFVEKCGVDLKDEIVYHQKFLFAAIQSKKLEIVKYLIDHGKFHTHIDFPDELRRSPFFYASTLECLDILTFLLSKGADVEHLNGSNETALYFASSKSVEVVKFLLQFDINLDVTTRNGETALYNACAKGNVEIVKLLIERCVDLNLATIQGCTPLFVATQTACLPIVKLLVEAGADVNKGNHAGITPLGLSSSFRFEMMKYLVEKGGADKNKANKEGETPIYIACSKEDITTVQYLLESGANPNLATNSGQTPLGISAFRGNLNILTLLIEKAKVDVDQYLNAEGETSLWSACCGGRIDVVRFFIERGAKADLANFFGQTPLYIASKFGRLPIVKYLLENVKDSQQQLNQIDLDGHTPLFVAVERKRIDVVRYLIERPGIDINKPNKKKQSPLFVACLEDLTIVQMLVEKGADLNQKDQDGKTPLLVACENEKFEIAKFLISKGCTLETNSRFFKYLQH